MRRLSGEWGEYAREKSGCFAAMVFGVLVKAVGKDHGQVCLGGRFNRPWSEPSVSTITVGDVFFL